MPRARLAPVRSPTLTIHDHAVGHDPPEPNDRFRILCAPMKSDRTAAAADTVIESSARNFFSSFFNKFFSSLLRTVYKTVVNLYAYRWWWCSDEGGWGCCCCCHRRVLPGHKRTSGGHHRKSGSVLWLLYAPRATFAHKSAALEAYGTSRSLFRLFC